MLRLGVAAGALFAYAAMTAAATPGAAAATSTAAIVRPDASGEAWSASDVTTLRGDLDALLSGEAAVRGAHVGVFAVDTRSGAPLYERNASDEFQPASTLKLLVGSVALERLGAAYRFHTTLERIGERLVLRAGGDPFLTSSDLAAAAGAARAAGVANASDVTIDSSHFAVASYPQGWVWDDFSYDYAVPISAASVDQNVRSYTISPGAAPGDPVRITSGNTNVVASTSCPGLVDRATTAAPNDSATLDTLTLAPDCTAVVGRLPAGATSSASIDIAVRDPVANVRGVFAAAFSARPVNVAASGDGKPAGSTVWQHASDPLAVWLGPGFWIPSDNFVAEQLLCEVGVASNGVAGSTESGLAVERAWLVANGIDPATTTLADGSGLSQYDRITPRDLVAVLQHDWNGPNRALVLDSLPIGGARGTIEGIAGTPAAGRVFAKTGSMSHVRGLAGYLATLRHGAVTFAFNVDDWNGDYASLAALRARVLARIIAS